jgi:hypothetical protein
MASVRTNTASQTLTLILFYCTYGKLSQKTERVTSENEEEVGDSCVRLKERKKK